LEIAAEKKMTTFHVSLNVSDLARSIEFYQKLFGTPPAKRRPDYAKFELEDPRLVLSLEPSGASAGGALNHLGFRLAGAQELVDLQRRLELAGLSSIREEGVECCYARQTKFWIQDPDKTLWEFYVLESDSDFAGDRRHPQTVPLSARPQPNVEFSSAGLASAPPTDDAIAPVDWEHRLGSPFSLPLPFAERSLNEIRLRGTFNVPCDSATRRAGLGECLRVLTPGGRIVLHHLTCDSPLPPDSLPLPGPAAVVEDVPVDTQLLASLEEAGFCESRLLKFGSTPSFSVGGVELRETIVQALKPHDAEKEQIPVMYKGPFRELVDDAGRVFRRGERIWISPAHWERLCSGPFEESFVRLRSERAFGPV
jgi:catechol 2,3-dioxygenase-like lactoylglutathione lyase family enzyme